MAKVINRFRDKHTGKLYEVNTDYAHDDEKRIDELVKGGFLEAEEPEPEKPKKKEKPEKPAAKKAKKDDA